MKVELVVTNRVQDLLHREADIAVRMAPPQQQQLVARRVGDIELGLHASERYLERHGKPASLDELARHTLIGFDRATAFLRGMGKKLHGMDRNRFDIRTDSDLAQLALIRAGAGIGVCQVALAKRDANLVRLLPRVFQFKLETWVTMHEDLRQSARCKVVFDALVEGLRAYA